MTLSACNSKTIGDAKITLTDLDSRCPGSLLKATPPPPGYPWVSGVRYVTPEPRFSGLVLDHSSKRDWLFYMTENYLVIVVYKQRKLPIFAEKCQMCQM